MTKAAPHRSTYDLSGNVALVTGGSRGLGREIVLAFAAAGADVAITSGKAESCAARRGEVQALGRQAFVHRCHVGHWDELDALMDAVYGEFGRIDILVNNAGKSPLYDKLVDVSEKLYDAVLDLNLKGPFRLTAIVATRMAEAGGGTVINISSTSSLRPDPYVLPYAAAKAGLHAMTVAWRRRSRPRCA